MEEPEVTLRWRKSDEPTRLDVGQPEPPGIPAPLSLEKAAELMGTTVEHVMRQVNEGKLRRVPGAFPYVIYLDGRDVLRACQQRAG